MNKLSATAIGCESHLLHLQAPPVTSLQKAFPSAALVETASLGASRYTFKLFLLFPPLVASDSPALNQFNVDLSIGIINACAWLTYWTPVAIKVISHNFAVSAIKFDAAIF